MGEVELEIGAALKTDWGRQSVCEMVGLASHEQLMLATTSALLALLICANCISHKTEQYAHILGPVFRESLLHPRNKVALTLGISDAACAKLACAMT